MVQKIKINKNMKYKNWAYRCQDEIYSNVVQRVAYSYEYSWDADYSLKFVPKHTDGLYLVFYPLEKRIRVCNSEAYLKGEGYYVTRTLVEVVNLFNTNGLSADGKVKEEDKEGKEYPLVSFLYKKTQEYGPRRYYKILLFSLTSTHLGGRDINDNYQYKSFLMENIDGGRIELHSMLPYSEETK